MSDVALDAPSGASSPRDKPKEKKADETAIGGPFGALLFNTLLPLLTIN